MEAEDRQRLNIRAIRVTLRAALGATHPANAVACLERARLLLEHARASTTAPRAVREWELLRAEIDEQLRERRAVGT